VLDEPRRKKVKPAGTEKAKKKQKANGSTTDGEQSKVEASLALTKEEPGFSPDAGKETAAVTKKLKQSSIEDKPAKPRVTKAPKSASKEIKSRKKAA